MRGRSSHHRVDFYNKASCRELFLFRYQRKPGKTSSYLKLYGTSVREGESHPTSGSLSLSIKPTVKDKHDRIISPPWIY